MPECGIFHQIKVRDGYINESNIPVVNKSYTSNHFKNIYEIIDCDVPLKGYNWASEKGFPYFIFMLPGRELKMKEIVYTRSEASFYPTSLEVLGFNSVYWETICKIDPISIGSYETATLSCQSSKFYSNFKFKQLTNSNNANYFEIWKLDILGLLRRASAKYVTCKLHKKIAEAYVFRIILVLYS